MKKRIILFSILVFVLNIIWEFSHSVLYIDLSGIPKNIHLITASFTDLFLVLGIFLIISLKNKNLNWIDKPKKSDYFLIIILSLIVSILIEIINVFVMNRWMYTPSMPKIFGIGLTPLLQLFITSIISLEISRRIKTN